MYSQDFTRSDRVSDQIRSEISFILKDQVKDPRLFGLTIIKVETTKDLKKAYIYYSTFNSFNQTKSDEVEIGLLKAKGFIRKLLSQRLIIKRVPEIFFMKDKKHLVTLKETN